MTASLSGRNLPVPATVAAWNHVTALARGLRRSGASGTLDELRVLVYLGLLSGQAASDLTAVPAGTEGDATQGETDVNDGSGLGQAATAGDRAGGTGTQGARGSSTAPGTNGAGGTGTQGAGAADTEGDGTEAADRGGRAEVRPEAGAGPEADSEPTTGAGPEAAVRLEAGAGPATGARQQQNAGGGNLIGSVNLTVPLTTLVGLGQSPGELSGFGPITAFAARDLAARALDAPAVRWCVTVTGENGEPIGHGCAAPSRPARNAVVSAFSLRISALAGTDCAHERESSHYRPPPRLWHLIQIRNPRCTAPGCRMPAAKCDDDHTVPYDQGGRSCECNFGPLCRYHHRVSSPRAGGLVAAEPGIFVWVTPSGRPRHDGPWQVRRVSSPDSARRAAHVTTGNSPDRARRAARSPPWSPASLYRPGTGWTGVFWPAASHQVPSRRTRT